MTNSANHSRVAWGMYSNNTWSLSSDIGLQRWRTGIGHTLRNRSYDLTCLCDDGYRNGRRPTGYRIGHDGSGRTVVVGRLCNSGLHIVQVAGEVDGLCTWLQILSDDRRHWLWSWTLWSGFSWWSHFHHLYSLSQSIHPHHITLTIQWLFSKTQHVVFEKSPKL